MIVRVFWNRTRRRWSVWKSGRLWRHMDEVWLTDAAFTVREAGRWRVLKTGRRNVHAWVEGTLAPERISTHRLVRSARYDPFTMSTFEDGAGRTVTDAALVWLSSTGRVWFE